jgi:hypothetical protein
MPSPLPLRNDDRILEHYVDIPVGVNYLNGNLHFTFATIRSDFGTDPAPQHRQITLRLVIPLTGAIDLQNHIAGIRELLQRQGIVQPIMPGPPTRQ